MHINPPINAASYWPNVIRIGILLCLLFCQSIPVPTHAQSGVTSPLQNKLKGMNQTVEDHVTRGAALLDEGDYDEAIAAFDEALALDANHARAYALRGKAHWLKNELDQALPDLNRALELDPEDADAYRTRGAVYAGLGQYAEAISDYDESLRLDPNELWTLARRGYTHSLALNYDASLADLNEAIRLNPQYVWAIVARGTTYNGIGDYNKALLDLTRAISLEPDNAWALATRGSTYRLLGEYEKAIADLNRALELTPSDQWALAERGRTYQEMGDYEQALADYDQVIAQNATYAWALVQRGSLYFDTERYDDALVDFSTAININPQYDWALAKRGETYQAREEYDAALTDFTAAIELNPEYGWYYAKRGDLLRIMARYDDALADAIQAVDLTPDDEFAWAVRGHIYRMLERYDDALADFSQAIELEPTYAWAYTMRGELYQLLDRDKDALADFEQAGRLQGVETVSAPRAAATPRPAPTATPEAPVAIVAPIAIGDEASVVQSPAAAQAGVVQIVAVGSFISPDKGANVHAGSGSGFIIDPRGIAVTNNHVVTGAALLKVYVDGYAQPLNARVLGVSECADLAVIDLEGDGFPYLTWYDGEITVGLDVYAAGYPLGDSEYTLTRGIIAKERANGQTSWSSLERVLQHDADMNPGNSGGPLLTEQGQVVGVNYATNAEFRQSFAIGLVEAMPIIEQLRLGNDVDSLGINGEAISNGEDFSGIWVYSVQSGSPADQAGIQGGDFILTMESLPMAADGTMRTYCDVVRSHSAEDTLDVEVLRLASEAVCSGQINGEPLQCNVVPTPTVAPQPLLDYEKISVDDGQVTFEAPADWNDIEAKPWSQGEETIGVQVNVAPDLNRFNTRWDSSGFSLYISTLLIDKTATTLLDSNDFSDQCTKVQREAFQVGDYQGYVDTWKDCKQTNNLLIVAAFAPADNSFIALLLFQTVNPDELEVADHVIATLVVNLTPPTPTPTGTPTPQAQTWINIEGGLKQVAVGCDGAVWGVSARDEIYRRAGHRWLKVDGSLAHISVGNAQEVWGVHSSGEVYQWTGNGWTLIPIPMKQVAVGCDGAVWGVNTNAEIFQREGNNWQQVDGRLAQIAVGSTQQVWGVGADGALYKREGNAWVHVNGILSWVAVGYDGTVWGVNVQQEVYRRDGDHWTKIGGSLKQIAVGDATHIWGVNAADLIFSWESAPTGAEPVFTTVQHDSGQFSISAPDVWTDRQSTVKGNYQQLIMRGKTDNTSAVVTLYWNQGAGAKDFDGALDEIRQKLEEDAAATIAACTYIQRDAITNSQFQGAFEQWDNCGSEKNHLFTVVMLPRSAQAYYLYFIILWNPAWDLAYLNDMLDSLVVRQLATAVVQTNTLNVRAGPGTNYGVVGRLNKGARLSVVGQASNCAWLQVQLPDGRQGWIAGQAPYTTLEGNCAVIPPGQISAAPVAGSSGGGSGGNGCILFQNHFNDEATVTLTSQDGKWNKTFKIGRKANYRECLPPGSYTYTVDVPPPWGSINGKLDISRGRTITFPIRGA